MRLGSLLSFSETTAPAGGPAPTPEPQTAQLAAAPAATSRTATPITVGLVPVTSTVSLGYNYCNDLANPSYAAATAPFSPPP